jgi:tetratricopeptide (TPR) repeat protein
MRYGLADKKLMGCFFLVSFAIAGMLLSLGGGVAAGQSATQPVPQRDHTTVEGVVRNPVGEVIADALVNLEGKDAAHSAEVKTKADGIFLFSVSGPGQYTVRAEKSGMRGRGSTTFELSASEKKHLDLILEPLAGGQIDSGKASSRPATIEFDDKPNFTVAGVTDWNNAGMHGSDATLRTSESLARDMLALESNGRAETKAGVPRTSVTPVNSADKDDELRVARKLVKKSLAKTDTADLHRLLGELNERLGDPLEAVREYERAAIMDASEQNYFEWGTELLLHKADQPAVEVFTKGARLHPGSARMLAGLGATLYASGSYEDAAHRLCEASDLTPEDSAPYLFLGKMQKSATALLPCSEEKLARFAREQPGNAWANYYYGIVVWKRDRGSENSAGLEQAETLLEKATAIDPKFGEAYLQLGILHSGRSKFEVAIRDYRKAIEVSPQLSEPHYRLGLAYRRVGEEAKAEQEFRLYEQLEKTETATLESQRRELRQFMIILKEQPPAPAPH